MGHCRTYFLPGVPHEMKKMFNSYVLPELNQDNHQRHTKIVHKTIVCFGLSESALGDTIKDIPGILDGVRIGTRSKFPELHIKIYATSHSLENANALLRQAEQICVSRLGKYIVSTTGETIQQVVGHLLKKENATLAIAESCTGGLIAHLMTQVPGSSDYFLCSAVTYANEAKTAILNVSHDTIQKYGAVSEKTVREMALGIRNKNNASYGLATSGIAGPGGGTPEKPVGTLCMAVASDSGINYQKIVLSFGTRAQKKSFLQWLQWITSEERC
ncbi:MAG: CinA-like protein [Candidatus Magnetoglobus multicellularis str. Araruama]|uniref:CinA-like protein n=1 Tax=Candidatus Magnetoglobus multicellularis str. Araruama TaxID=890399 RepID=A0A1V1PC28_9BACT|nr:MAG: CinA-like protein [Candidatus Magnetoglobus multicellularis str. Araruama]